MKKYYVCLVVVVIFALLQGCASVVTQGKQKMSFQSEPPGVTVSIDGKELGKTPLITKVKRKKNQKVTFSKPGYVDVNLEMMTNLEPWFWGNILIGGFIGSTTDGMSGSTVRYSQDQYYVTMKLLAGPKPLKHRVKDFVVFNYEDISKNISQGGGEYLISLSEILGEENISELSDTVASLISAHGHDRVRVADELLVSVNSLSKPERGL